MWPFDKILLSRIHDLERTIEMVNGANCVLEKELNDSKLREANLLDKIFNITGVNRISNNGHQKDETKSTDPIRLTNRSRSWPEVRQSLETQSRAKYWEDKKEREEIKSRKSSSPEQIDQLEQDVIGGIDNAK